MTESKLKCVWQMSVPCSDEVREVEFFDGKITVPVCTAHIEQHWHIMVLHQNGYDMQEVLQKDPDYWKEQVLLLDLAGLIKDIKM